MNAFDRLTQESGIALEIPGTKETALRRADALQAVALLRELGIPVLGGDVYLKTDSALVVTYDNWHADRKSSEKDEKYLERTWDITRDFIQRYPDTSNGEPLFVFVLGRR